MLKRSSLVLGLAVTLLLVLAGPAMAFQGKVSDAMCVGTCHTRPGFADFDSWHVAHYSLPIGLTCDACHPNGHTVPTASAPETLYWLGEACTPCHWSVDILPAHSQSGVASCGGCHPASVRKGTLSGTVGDGSGPLAGVSVTVSGMAPVVTAEDGSYVVPGISVGLCTATFEKAGYEVRTIDGIGIQNGATTTRDATLVLASPIDTLAPTTSSDAQPTYTGSATIHLDATDGFGGSGVAHTYFRIDGGARNEGREVSVAALGPHTLEFWSIDEAGNEETPHRASAFVVSAPARTSTSITIATSAASARVGGAPVLSGRVTPTGMIGVNIVVWVMKPGKTYWTYSSNRTVYSLSGSPAWQYRYTFKPGMTKGSYRFKALAPAPGFASSDAFATSSSRVIAIRLR